MSPHSEHTVDAGRLALPRRGFLKLAGFTLAGTGLAGCSRAPVNKAIPFLVQPEEIVPGKATWYASTCGGCSAGCGVLVKNRDGRPIKIEGSPEHPISRGGLCAIGQSYLLGLYDSHRLKGPLAAGKPAEWAAVDAQITRRLDEIAARGGRIRLLTATINSPTASAVIARFMTRFRDARHVMFDALSVSAILDAHEQTHGIRALPRYRFDKADVIAGVEADFLGTWFSPVEHTRAYVEGRRLEEDGSRCSRHIQFESRMSLTGAKADRRIRIRPSEAPALLAAIAAELEHRQGGTAAVEHLAPEHLAVADALWNARGRSMIVCGINQLDVQLLTNRINELLGAYDELVDLRTPSRQSLGDDRVAGELLEEIRSGKVDALLVYGLNPVCELPGDVAEALRKVPLLVSFAERIDETAELAHYVCPDHHPLEAWRDAEPVSGVYGLTQPTIQPLAKTRGLVESLAAWIDQPASEYQLMQECWKAEVFPKQRKAASFQAFWDQAVHDGWVTVEVADTNRKSAIDNRQFAASAAASPASRPASGLELVLYPKVALRDGRHAHNPWLQELPDPITKIAWDNYASLSPGAAARLQVREGDVLRIAISEGETPAAGSGIELPAHIQPGQHDDVVAIAVGYGRKGTERFAAIGPQWLEGGPTLGPNGLVGVSAAPLLRWDEGRVQFAGASVTIEKTGRQRKLASTQEYHSIEVPARLAPKGKARRDAAREVSVSERRTANSEQPGHAGAPAHEAHGSQHPSMWPDEHGKGKHRWGMVVDMASCTGCAACVVGCQAENNIPVVGRDELARGREMHWLRIDRYYAGGDEDPRVLHQPMLCQHCDNAPCETVCPVLATVHSDEGLNQQVYNRCVGTRYCANNCPYKMRRFNWFNYTHGDELQHLVLNPDVTVRSRGVMEKCSFCVQRIQEAKIEAKRRGVPLADGDVRPACQQSCPAGAIVFGDMNDPDSAVSRKMKSGRAYRVLEELNVLPAVTYLAAVRNEPGELTVDHV